MSPLLFKRLRIGDSQQLPGLDEAQPESGATSGFEVGVQQPGLTSLRLEMNRFHRTAPVTTSKVALLPYGVLERLSASLSLPVAGLGQQVSPMWQRGISW